MKNIKSLLITAFTLVVAAVSANAAWVPTGSTRFESVPSVNGANGQHITVSAQLLVQEKFVNSSGHYTGQTQWTPYPNLPVQFLVHPSTGAELVPNSSLHTDGQGWVSSDWKIPRNNKSHIINFTADFPGVVINGKLIYATHKSGSIYVH